MECLGCKELMDKSFWWDDVTKTFTCQVCSKQYEVCGDSSFDEETCDEDCWFWLEEVT
jgi:hypothetical protein